jgi:choline monooxygenase
VASAPDDPRLFARLRESLFARSWQLVAHESELGATSTPAALPVTVLPGMLDEPLLLVRDGGIRALSNACTHRGALVCEEKGAVAAKTLRCRYHGRRFALDGRCLGAPGFDAIPERADLPRAGLASWKGFLFASVLEPVVPFEELIADLSARTAWLPVESAVLDPARSRDYEVRANWTLYCDNYLEGFHVPYVHAGLVPALDLASYRCETFRWSNVQVGAAPPDAPALEPPRGAPDHGTRVAGYYFWLFPSTLVNVYPWGLSLNLVQPLAPGRTRVCFRTWVWNAELLDRGAGADLHRIEMEDEAVVESAQRGMHGRLWRAGAYAPGHEDCVAHFHRLLSPFATDER